MEGLLAPDSEEKVTGTVEIREVFKITKVGAVAGCYVTEGKISRNNEIRLIRNGVVTFTGKIATLKRFKDDVKDVAAGYECGIQIENYNDIKEGDVIESFETIEVARKL
jgi:translation initiation factor IF-2